jgi:hypothetical protein
VQHPHDAAQLGPASVLGGKHPLNAVVSSLGAFLAALARPRTPLVRAIRLVLVVKLIAIAAIAIVMLPGAGRRGVDATAMFRLIAPPIFPFNRDGS